MAVLEDELRASVAEAAEEQQLPRVGVAQPALRQA
jgi:hypothetical protein